MKIRLWKLGSLEHKIFPTSEAIKRLRDILGSIGDGTVDIVWGPEIEVVELDVDKTVENYVVDSMTEVDGKLTIEARKI